MPEHGTATITFDLPANPIPASVPRYLRVKDCAKILNYSYLQMWAILTGKDGPPLIRMSQRRILVPYDEFISWVNSKGKS